MNAREFLQLVNDSTFFEARFIDENRLIRLLFCNMPNQSKPDIEILIDIGQKKVVLPKQVTHKHKLQFWPSVQYDHIDQDSLVGVVQKRIPYLRWKQRLAFCVCVSTMFSFKGYPNSPRRGNKSE